MSRIPTLAFLTRVCEAELPYILPFVKRCFEAGATILHIIIQDASLKPRVDSICSLYKSRFFFHLMPTTLTPNQCLQSFDYSEIQAEYTGLLDIDEYFYSPVYKTIPDALVSKRLPDWIYPYWIMAPCDFINSDRQAGFLGHIGKQIAKTALIKGLLSPHAFLLEGENSLTYESQFLYRPNDCFIIHYWGRTFRDCLLKTTMHLGMPEIKQTSIEQLLALTKKNKLANRLKLLACLNLHPRYINIPDYLNNEIDFRLEQELIERQFSTDKLNNIIGIYKKYKECLEIGRYERHYPSVGDLRTLFSLLPE